VGFLRLRPVFGHWCFVGFSTYHTMTTTTTTPTKPERILRMPAVLARFPVSKAHWEYGVKLGRYPTAIQLTARTKGWRESDIDKLIASMSEQGGAK
jgi:prophage regulatory protein